MQKSFWAHRKSRQKDSAVNRQKHQIIRLKILCMRGEALWDDLYFYLWKQWWLDEIRWHRCPKRRWRTSASRNWSAWKYDRRSGGCGDMINPPVKTLLNNKILQWTIHNTWIHQMDVNSLDSAQVIDRQLIVLWVPLKPLLNIHDEFWKGNYYSIKQSQHGRCYNFDS